MVDKCGEHALKGPERSGVRQAWRPLVHRSRQAPRPRHGCRRVLLPQARHEGDRRGRAFGMLPANGIGLSPDENTVYVAETPTARLWASKSPRRATIKPRDVIYRGERGKPIAGLGGYQMFDSLAVEASGNVCVATLISGCISVIAPDGSIVEQVPTGDRVTTNIAFGGPELKTAYITLSGKGELIAMDWARPGLPLNFLNK